MPAAFNFLELKMEKVICRHTREGFESKAQDFIRLIFAVTEKQSAVGEGTSPVPRNKALAAAALSVQEAIKAYLAVMYTE